MEMEKNIKELKEIVISGFSKVDGEIFKINRELVKVNERLFLLEDKTDLLKERVDRGFADVNAKLSKHWDMFSWLGTKVVEDHKKRLVALERS